ncbi:hypothetical protein [Ferrovibrio sp.]|uniref:hypothetical protein n=1 Tax=Ferrovibrio sp. TaxID=1917215 RepID=UPI00351493C2
MAFCTEAAMVLYYDIAGDTADHDDWHTYEHMHERLSVPGFMRASRWVAADAATAPRYLVVYEVTGTDIATAPAYLERLNNPTPWTSAMMPRFRGMVRGFAAATAGAGFGLGCAAVSLRFAPQPGREQALIDSLGRDILPAMASRRGMAGLRLLRPAPPPPMTREQAIRGADAPLAWLLLATAYDAGALQDAVADHCGGAALKQAGAAPGIAAGRYSLHYTASAPEAARISPNPPLRPDLRQAAGVRR